MTQQTASTGDASQKLVAFSKQCWPRIEVVCVDDVTGAAGVTSKGDDKVTPAQTQVDFSGKTIGLSLDLHVHVAINICLEDNFFRIFKGLVRVPSCGFSVTSPVDVDRPVSAFKTVRHRRIFPSCV